MCMVFYLGSDTDAPRTAAWSKESPAFHVVDPPTGVVAAVREKLPHVHVRYVGSHEGCGCGFRSERDGFPIVHEGEEAVAEAQDHAALVRYLELLANTERPLQIFGCWSGDENEPVEHRRDCKIRDLADSRFMFRERELITLR